MVESCNVCGNHEDEDICRTCNHCQRQHTQKYGIPWVQNRAAGLLAKPCIHICRFTLPNKQKITYKCNLNMGHKGQCDFPVNKYQLERMARECQ